MTTLLHRLQHEKEGQLSATWESHLPCQLLHGRVRLPIPDSAQPAQSAWGEKWVRVTPCAAGKVVIELHSSTCAPCTDASVKLLSALKAQGHVCHSRRPCSNLCSTPCTCTPATSKHSSQHLACQPLSTSSLGAGLNGPLLLCHARGRQRATVHRRDFRAHALEDGSIRAV
jgi:hypothetical protein